MWVGPVATSELTCILLPHPLQGLTTSSPFSPLPPAQAYIWAGDMDAIWQDREWSFPHFREHRLQDWFDLFDGMEMVGLKASLNCWVTSPTALQTIANAIRRCGQSANVFLPRSTRSTPNYTVWNVTLDVTILEETSTMSDTDSQEDTECFGVEIVSPVLKVDSDWARSIESVLGSSRLPAFVSLKTNRSTGLHVHVGYSDGFVDRFTLEQLKLLAVAVVFFEGTIDQLHSPSRSVATENPDILSNRNNQLLRELSDSQAIDVISKATSITEVISAMRFDESADYSGYGESKTFKVNFSSFNKCGTVEFRQRIATTDCAALIQWVEFMVLFVQRSLEKDISSWTSISAECKGLSYLFLDFLNAPALLEKMCGPCTYEMPASMDRNPLGTQDDAEHVELSHGCRPRKDSPAVPDSSKNEPVETTSKRSRSQDSTPEAPKKTISSR
ncbi:uncharacterized protein CDV56_101089 [Aspergillus thermomutatus]|uniref:Uncharacterized protein n=1 Tax=Aspergillus thermomutatus TaxID=41047 RepID=A0A397GHK5_ASPTH|nr:uncharacterized protein CDV56_101089 [Aspergillus thermomutatus]RHZ47510.1 hypothetical protein CDV56_101089 [Aspergillus thermomutatus]